MLTAKEARALAGSNSKHAAMRERVFKEIGEAAIRGETSCNFWEIIIPRGTFQVLRRELELLGYTVDEMMGVGFDGVKYFEVSWG